MVMIITETGLFGEPRFVDRKYGFWPSVNRWRRTLCRQFDGSFVYHSPTYGGLSSPLRDRQRQS